jgi:hypothetical protein
VWVNEFSTNPSDGNDWIELYNKGGGGVDLSGWRIAHVDGGGGLQEYTLPAGVSLPAGGFAVFYRVQSGIDLDERNGTIRLYDAGGVVVDEVYYSAEDFGFETLPPDSSVGRKPDGGLEYLQDPSPGQSNPAAACTSLLLAGGWNLISFACT